jgi:hypothetical protein
MLPVIQRTRASELIESRDELDLPRHAGFCEQRFDLRAHGTDGNIALLRNRFGQLALGELKRDLSFRRGHFIHCLQQRASASIAVGTDTTNEQEHARIDRGRQSAVGQWDDVEHQRLRAPSFSSKPRLLATSVSALGLRRRTRSERSHTNAAIDSISNASHASALHCSASARLVRTAARTWGGRAPSWVDVRVRAASGQKCVGQAGIDVGGQIECHGHVFADAYELPMLRARRTGGGR